MIHVIKLGGSLLGMSNLRDQLNTWLSTLQGEQRIMLVGGASAADAVRAFDTTHGLSEQAGHWLAVRAMQLNTYMVAQLIDGRIVCNADDAAAAWRDDKTALIDPLAWLQTEHARGVTIPHVWQFTSDSIAAHIAVQLNAKKLTLLKSTCSPAGCGMMQAAHLGIVDPCFIEVAGALPGGLPSIDLVNLRSQPPTYCTLR